MTSYEVRVKGRKKVGPLPAELIVRGLELKRVPFDAQVREAGSSEWVPLASIDEFYEAMGLDDAQTRVNQRPLFEAVEENDGDEATRVLSSLWSDRPPRSPPSGHARPLPPPLPAPFNPRDAKPQKRAPTAARVPPPPAPPLPDESDDDARTSVVEAVPVASHATRPGNLAPAVAARPGAPPAILPPPPAPPPVHGGGPFTRSAPGRDRPGSPPPNRPTYPGQPAGAPTRPSSALELPPARPALLTPSPEAAALMDADEDDDDLRVVRDIPGAKALPGGPQPAFQIRPAAGIPVRPSQNPHAGYRPDRADELTAPARRMVRQQERTRMALLFVSVALGLALVVLTAVLLLR